MSYSLVGAITLHVLLLGVGMFGSCHFTQQIEDPEAALKLLPVDFVAPNELPPGGGDGLLKARKERADLPPDNAEPVVHRVGHQAPPAVITAPAKEKGEREDENDDNTFVTIDAGADAEPPDAEAPPDWDAYRPSQISIEDLLASRRSAQYESAAGDSGKAGPGGTHGGWGGLGYGLGGWGEGARGFAPIIKGKFAFGGAVGGAFTGVVCAIPVGTSALSQIKECTESDVIGKFGTNEFNVAARKFTDGFPGLSGRNEWFAIEYTGKFKVKKEGTYQFRLLSDDGSKLIIDGELVIDNDGTHGPSSKSGETLLTVGDHPMRLDYFQGPRWDIALQLFVTPPGGEERLFGPVLP